MEASVAPPSEMKLLFGQSFFVVPNSGRGIQSPESITVFSGIVLALSPATIVNISKSAGTEFHKVTF